MNKLIMFATAVLVALPCFPEEPVYVGEGRYSCSGNTIECSTLKQRNNEISIRQRERWEDERRYERAERRERQYEHDSDYHFSDRPIDY